MCIRDRCSDGVRGMHCGLFVRSLAARQVSACWPAICGSEGIPWFGMRRYFLEKEMQKFQEAEIEDLCDVLQAKASVKINCRVHLGQNTSLHYVT